MSRVLLLSILVGCSGSPPRAPVVTQRPYAVQVPSTYDAAHPAPVLVDLPAFTSDAFDQEQYLQLGRVALAHGALYVMVNGNKSRGGQWYWNASGACCDFYGEKPDDVGYLDAVLDDVAAHYAIDRKRVFVVGHSNGGFMAHRYACDRPGRVAAFASLAGAAPAHCTPSEPVAALEIHGDADGTIKYTGGTLASPEILQRWSARGMAVPDPAKVEAYPGALASLEPWRTADGCTTSTAGPPIDLEAKLDGAETEVTRWTCRAGAVELWTIHGGSHLPDLQAGFAEQVWTWFAAHPRS